VFLSNGSRGLPINSEVTEILEERQACSDDIFDRLALLAARATGSPAAFVSLADCPADEILFAGITGLPEVPAGHRLPLSATICRHVVASGEPLAVEDTKAHPLGRNEATLHELGIEAYLGVPLKDAQGDVVGVLCTVDRHAREWTPTQVVIAEGLASAVMTEIGLRAAEHRYRSLIENLPLVSYIHTVDEPFRCVYMSPQVESLLGYSADEWIAGPELATEWIHPADRERVAALAREARTEGVPTRCEFRFLARDGRVVWVLDQTIPVRDADGAIVGYQGFLLDVTERKELEEQLRQSQKMEAIGKLAGGIAHDFNNMLTAIGGYAELLASSFDEGDPRADDLEQIRRASDHAAALTRQLLAFSRKQVLLPQRLDVNSVVRDLERMLHRTIGADVEVVTELDDAVAPVEADPDQLARVVLNIALNARDAMPDGGELRIATANVRRDELPYVAVQVTDTGSGMDDETRGRIFEPFFTTKEQGKGTGLGLATAYGVVEQSGGRIEVESAPGAGSTFRVLLPAA
jgi:two-component system, cell cycle sensor histidine kinase and response regulator CckA